LCFAPCLGCLRLPAKCLRQCGGALRCCRPSCPAVCRCCCCADEDDIWERPEWSYGCGLRQASRCLGRPFVEVYEWGGRSRRAVVERIGGWKRRANFKIRGLEDDNWPEDDAHGVVLPSFEENHPHPAYNRAKE